MAKALHPAVAEYIRKINANEDFSLIILNDEGLTDEDIQPLFDLLAANSKKAKSVLKLYLHNNQLTSFSLPKELTALDSLYLDNNQLTSFSPPKELTALRGLYLHNNQLTSFSPPKELTALQYLHLHNNQLTSFSLPKELTALGSLYLDNNWLNGASLALLRALRIFNNNIEITTDNLAAIATARLTIDALEQHFDAMPTSFKPANHLPLQLQKTFITRLLQTATALAQAGIVSRAAAQQLTDNPEPGAVVQAHKPLSGAILALFNKDLHADLRAQVLQFAPEMLHLDIILNALLNPEHELEALREAFTLSEVQRARLTPEQLDFFTSSLSAITAFKQQHQQDLDEKQKKFVSANGNATLLAAKILGMFADFMGPKPAGEPSAAEKSFYKKLKTLLEEYDFDPELLTSKEFVAIITPLLVSINRRDRPRL